MLERMGVLACVGLLGCGSVSMMPSGPAQPPREPGCKFDLFTAAPAGNYAEVGVIDVSPGAYGGKSHREIADFKKEIAPFVCKAGGDAAIALANGFGIYLKATVLKKLPEPAAAAKPAAALAEGGCQYDTQCKGDRVCEKGVCVSPPASPSTPTTQP